MEKSQPTPGLTFSEDFRCYLQAEFLRRCRQRPSYSLRAFARNLDVESSALSKILRGRRGVSAKMLLQMTDKLGLNPREQDRFLPSRRRSQAQIVRHQGAGPKQLAEDLFEIVADWYHYAILDLTRIQGFRTEPLWIARALGISATEANIAIQRLERSGFIRYEKDGTWTVLLPSNTTLGTAFAVPALRRMQRQVLEKALAALEDVSIEHRDQSSMTMAIDSRLLPEAKKRITRFRRDLCAFLENGPGIDHVYQLGISLYPLTTPLIKETHS